MDEMHSDELVGVTWAASVIGVSAVTMRRWCAAGRVPGARQTPGGYWRIPRWWVKEQVTVKPLQRPRRRIVSGTFPSSAAPL